MSAVDYGQAVLGIDVPCGEGMCRCDCDQGCVCGCECPGSPDEWHLGECDHCYGWTTDGHRATDCACANGDGAEDEDCHCGPPAGEVAQ